MQYEGFKKALQEYYPEIKNIITIKKVEEFLDKEDNGYNDQNDIINEASCKILAYLKHKLTGQSIQEYGSPDGIFTQAKLSRQLNREAAFRGYNLKPLLKLLNQYADSCQDTWTASESFTRFSLDRAIDYFATDIADYVYTQEFWQEKVL